MMISASWVTALRTPDVRRVTDFADGLVQHRNAADSFCGLVMNT
jgi:hypothetical protein